MVENMVFTTLVSVILVVVCAANDGIENESDTCKDAIPNCAEYTSNICQEHLDWTKQNCAKFCRFCVSEPIGRNNTTPGGLCNDAYSIKIDTTMVLTIDNIVDPVCKILLIGDKYWNDTYERVCYRILNIQVPCGDNFITIEEVSVVYNNTGYGLERREILNVSCDSNVERDELPPICPTHFYFGLKFHVFITEVTSSGRIRLEAEKPPIGEIPKPQEMLGKMNQQAVRPDQDIDEMENELMSHYYHHTEESPTVETPTAPLDINNIITIVGGIVTSLFIPLILLFVRRMIQKKTKESVKESVKRPAGCHEVDGKADNDDNHLRPTSRLLTPRPSIQSGATEFHSTFSSLASIDKISDL